jgi:hypothetical protein
MIAAAALRLLAFAVMPTLSWIGKEAVVNHPCEDAKTQAECLP